MNNSLGHGAELAPVAKNLPVTMYCEPVLAPVQIHEFYRASPDKKASILNSLRFDDTVPFGTMAAKSMIVLGRNHKYFSADKPVVDKKGSPIEHSGEGDELWFILNPTLASQIHYIDEALADRRITEETPYEAPDLPNVPLFARFAAAVRHSRAAPGTTVGAAVPTIGQLIQYGYDFNALAQPLSLGMTSFTALTLGGLGYFMDRQKMSDRLETYRNRLRNTFGRVGYLENHPDTKCMVRVPNTELGGVFPAKGLDIQNAIDLGVKYSAFGYSSVGYEYSPARLLLNFINSQGTDPDIDWLDGCKSVMGRFAERSWLNHALQATSRSKNERDLMTKIDADIFALLVDFKSGYEANRKQRHDDRIRSIAEQAGHLYDTEPTWSNPLRVEEATEL